MSINAIRDYLIEKYRPKAILLHGSRLGDEAIKSSDWDIIILTTKPEEVFPHVYQGMMLDIEGLSPETGIVKTSSKVPKWPLEVLYDDADLLGRALSSETERAYRQGPEKMIWQEWENRRNYSKRLVDKICERGAAEPSLRRYYLSDFYMRAVRYWFEKRQQWTMSPYRALPLIKERDLAFFEQLQAIWSEDYIAATRDIHRLLFEK